MDADDPHDRELLGLLERIHDRAGVDLRGYARAPLRRRLQAWIAEHHLRDLAEVGDRMVDDAAVLPRLIDALVQHDTPLFGDPDGDRALRDEVVPFLRTYPSVNVWVPACGGGAEAYATAIVLREEGVSARAHVYATDLSEPALGRARQGIYSMASVRAAEPGYLRGGGRSTLAEYYAEAGDDEAVVRPILRDHVTFVQHDLATGGSFNEFHLIRARDILPALGPTLQGRVFGLFHDSLVRFGVLALGPQDAHRLRPPLPPFEILDPRARLYRRAR